jgi:hypothetical protein
MTDPHTQPTAQPADTAAHGAADADERGHDINTPLVATIGVVSVVLIFGVVIPGLLALVYNAEQRHITQRVHKAQYTELRAHEADQYERITGQPRWINEQKGIVGISIDHAMRLYAQRHDSADTPAP